MGNRGNLELLRINNQETRIRSQVAAGQLDGPTGDTLIAPLESSKQNIGPHAAEDLVDLVYKGQLADAKGLTVTDAEVQAKMDADASNPERRARVRDLPRAAAGDLDRRRDRQDRQKALANATAAAAALAEGTSFEVVAQQYSTDASKTQGGDYGFLTASDTVDPAWVAGAVRLPANGTTPVIKGDDGTYRIGTVREIAPPTHGSALQPGRGRKVGDQAYRDSSAWRRSRPSSSRRSSPTPPPATSTRSASAEIYIGVHRAPIRLNDGQVHASTSSTPRRTTLPTRPASPPEDPAWAAGEGNAQKTADEPECDHRRARSARRGSRRSPRPRATTRPRAPTAATWASSGPMVRQEFADPLFNNTAPQAGRHRRAGASPSSGTT